MGEVKFSVVIPAHNAAAFLCRAVDSIKKQSFKEWEIIVVENGSTDDTYEIGLSIFQSEKGVSNARNKGIDLASGEWIVFLDADDSLTPDALKFYYEVIDDDIQLICGRYVHNKINNSNERVFKGKEETKKYLSECLKDPTQKCNSTGCAFKKSFLDSNNIRFDKDLSFAEDSEFLVNALTHCDNAADIDRHIYEVYVNPNSAVRAMNDSAIKKYSDSIEKIRIHLEGMGSNIDNAFQVFILSQLLVVLTNNVFAHLSFKEAVSKTRELCALDVFSEAVKKIELKDMSASRKLVFFLMKRKAYYLLGDIIKARITVKNRGKNK